MTIQSPYSISAYAVKTGTFTEILSLKSEGYPFDRLSMKGAIKTNKCFLIIWLRNQGVEWCGEEMNWAARKGHVAVLHLLTVLGAPFSDCALNHAAFNGHVQAVDWLYKQTTVLIYSRKIFMIAAAEGHVEILKWFKETLNSALSDKKIMKPKIGYIAIAQEKRNVFLWLREIKAIFDETSSAIAASVGDLECLKTLREDGVPWDERVRIWAAQERKFEVYNWAKENGAPVTPLTRGLIACYGNSKKTRSKV